MPNHIHVIYKALDPYNDGSIKHSFLSHTAKKLLENISTNVVEMANKGIPVFTKEKFLVQKSNKKYQLWKTPSLSVHLISPKFLDQKMNYIHDNPRRANLVIDNADYKYCSWSSYEKGESEFEFLTLL